MEYWTFIIFKASYFTDASLFCMASAFLYSTPFNHVERGLYIRSFHKADNNPSLVTAAIEWLLLPTNYSLSAG